MAVHVVPFVPPETRIDLPVTSVGPDWLTGTTADRERSDRLEHFAMFLLRRREQEGYEVRDWYGNGFSGDATDGISIGIRGEEAMVRLSGEMALRYAGVTMEMLDHVSRIDWQVTLHDEDTKRDWADIVTWTVEQDERVKKGTTTITQIASNRGGKTLYIGRRVSERFFRVYDKTAESEGLYADRTWRFEVEYKGKRADSFRQRWDRLEPQTSFAQRAVYAAFADYGFRLPATRVGPSFKDKSPRGPTSDQRRLEYLERCITPMVDRLIECFGRERLLEVLRLNRPEQEV
jgi:hypothetical protein